MSEKYKEYCMKFSNEEIRAYMVDYLISNSMNNKLIKYLSEDGDDENLFINFYGIHTSIFVDDTEIMFIDENSKGTYTSSDVYNNVVYEGNLRDMSHEEMLKMFSDIILCFYDAEDISIFQLDVPENAYKKYNYYEPHRFIIEVKNSNEIQKESIYENITIKH